MKIKQIEQISDTEVNITWENGEVQNLKGQPAVTLLQMTEMKVGEFYYFEHYTAEDRKELNFCGAYKVYRITEQSVEFCDAHGEKVFACDYDSCVCCTFKSLNYPEKQSTAKERVETELDELSLKCRKLETFVISPKFTELGYAQQYLLQSQLSAMLEYENCLKARLDCWDK